MYYETTMHKRRPVDGPDAAAQLIHDGHIYDYDALTWTAPDGREMAVVADNHCNDPWFEVAVIDLTNSVQIESITIGWCRDLDTKTRLLRECETTDFRMRAAKIPLDGHGDDTPASFECGCCGSFFKSTLAVQKQYDQDNGYGICPKCCRHY